MTRDIDTEETRKFEFSTAVDLQTALERETIDTLEVDASRMYIVYANSVFHVEVLSMGIHETDTIRFTLTEGPDHGNTPPEDLLDRFERVLKEIDTRAN